MRHDIIPLLRPSQMCGKLITFHKGTGDGNKFQIPKKMSMAGPVGLFVCLFVCGGSLTSGQLVKGSFQTA